MIRVTPCGAAGEVTGSGLYIETRSTRLLVDFGIFQGGNQPAQRSRELGPVDPATLQTVVLTHAHVDHAGRVPLLYARGYDGGVVATPATFALTPILLEDVARLDAERTADPIYRPEDVRRMHQSRHLRVLPWRQTLPLPGGAQVTLHDAGHIMGASSAVLAVESGGRSLRMVFSGDLGPPDVPLLRDPDPPQGADVVFLESTYGGRSRVPLQETIEAFKGILEAAARAGETVLIPAFAVGRTQLLLFYLAEAVREGRLPRDLPVVLDSPMAAKATEALFEHPEVLDADSRRLVDSGQLARDLASLVITRSAAESKALNDSREPCVIVSASGMCEGGRVVHHLRHRLGRGDVHVVIVGYMAEGTLGRALAEGAGEVEIEGQVIPVRARIHVLDGFSAHADHGELLSWLAAVIGPSRRLPSVVLTHGEDMAREALAAGIRERWGIEPLLPRQGERLDF